MRNTFRFKLVVSGLLTVIAVLLFRFAGEELITFYLSEEEGGRAVGDTLRYGRDYLNVMLIGLLPYAAAQSYASTLRDTGWTPYCRYSPLPPRPAPAPNSTGSSQPFPSTRHFTSMNIVPMYLCCILIDLIKCAIGLILLKRRAWVRNIVA